MPRHDHYARGAFGSSFGGSAGCVYGAAFALGTLLLGGCILGTMFLGGFGWFAKKAIDEGEARRQAADE